MNESMKRSLAWMRPAYTRYLMSIYVAKGGKFDKPRKSRKSK